MILRVAIAALVSLLAVSCGVKTELERPDMQVIQKNQNDPSKPPHPLGEPGGTDTLPPTGP